MLPLFHLTSQRLTFSFLYFLLLVSCTRQTSQWTVLLLGLPLNTSTFSRLRCTILSQLALLLFLPYSPINYGWQYFFWRILHFFCHLNFVASLFVFCSYTPGSALYTVFLVVLEHPSIILAAVICSESRFFFQLRVTFPCFCCILKPWFNHH